MTETLLPPRPHRCLGDLLYQLANLTREYVETARLRERAGDEAAALAFYSAAERLVEIVRADAPLPIPPSSEFPPVIADAFHSVLAATDTKIASEVATGRVDGPSALRVFHTIRDVVAATDSGLAARISPRLTAMVTRE